MSRPFRNAALLVAAGCAGAGLLLWATSVFVHHGLGNQPVRALVTPRPVLAWSVEVAPEPASLHAVSITAGGEAFAVGAGGAIFHRRAGAWSKEPSPTTGDLNALAAGSGAVLVFAVGDHGTILARSRDAPVWSVEKAPTTENLAAIAACPTGFIAVGAHGTVLQRSDETHAWTASDARTTVDLHGVAGWVSVPATPTSAPSLATFVVGDGGTILVHEIPFGRAKNAGAEWTAQASRTTENLFAATFLGSEIVVVGAHGTVLRGDLSSDAPWGALPPPASESLRDARLVSTGSSSRLLVVGESAVFEQRFLEEYTWRPSLAQRGLVALDADSANVITVGEKGALAVAAIPLQDE